MIDTENIYLGIHEDAKKAAMLFDLAMVQAKGLQAKKKLNFKYNALQVLSMLLSPSIIQMKREYDKKFTIREEEICNT
jgi:hypothetical protein